MVTNHTKTKTALLCGCLFLVSAVVVLGELPFFFFFFQISPPCTPSSLNSWIVNDLGKKEYGKTGKEIMLGVLGRFLKCCF